MKHDNELGEEKLIEQFHGTVVEVYVNGEEVGVIIQPDDQERPRHTIGNCPGFSKGQRVIYEEYVKRVNLSPGEYELVGIDGDFTHEGLEHRFTVRAE